jgi:hypothetical protein
VATTSPSLSKASTTTSPIGSVEAASVTVPEISPDGVRAASRPVRSDASVTVSVSAPVSDVAPL